MIKCCSSENQTFFVWFFSKQDFFLIYLQTQALYWYWTVCYVVRILLFGAL
jgi:hypothetical protein